MTDRHVILRSTFATTAGVSVEVDDIDTRAILALARDAEVLAIARAIPMRLIAPVEEQDAVEPATDTTAWGVRAIGADTSPFSGDGIVVAVLDTGIDDSHPAFAGVDIVQKDFTGEGNGDQHGHGTHCAGTIFGKTIGGQRIGVAPGIKRALIGKVLGAEGGSSDQVAWAIQWAVDNGANVISMSLGIDFLRLLKLLQEEDGLPAALAMSQALEGYRTNVQLFERLASLHRTQEAFGQAAVTIAAAGNENTRDQNSNSSFAVSQPAAAEGIVSVAALGEGDQGLILAPFSNTGANVSGPGVWIVSAKAGGGLTVKSGTSMATQHVAGAAALWAERIKTTSPLSALQLTSRLIGSATTDGLQAGLDPFDIGAGLVRAPQQG